MILNGYAILIAFIGLLRLALGLLVVGAAVAAWRARGRPVPLDGQTVLENRGYLLSLLTLLLIGLNFASWPLLYLLLQSYVPEWPNVMCIYGVTQVGTGSVGPSRILPDLLLVLQVIKPAVVFAGGGWFVLYLLNRRTLTGPLLGRLFIVLVLLGALAAVDAAAELAYIAIPKKEEFPPGACCLQGGGDFTRFFPPEVVGDAARPWLVAAFAVLNLGLILALAAATRRRGAAPGAGGLASLVVAGVAGFAVSALFLVEVAAPRLLHLPHHHCAYDLIDKVPEAVVAAALYVAGFFFLGWAGVARWLGRTPETAPALAGTVRCLLSLSLWAYAAALAMLALELALA
jgi:hypothetical protein